MSSYSDLPFLDNLTLPVVTYQYAQAIRAPLARAINQARSQPDEKMDDVVTLLEAALAHIRQEETQDVEDATFSDDPSDVLAGLLGSTEAEPDAD